MNVAFNPYLQNLAQTCQQEKSVIDKEGKSRPWYKAVVQIFRRKQKTAYFAESCQKLKEAIQNGTINTLSTEDMFNILFRMEKISSKLSKNDNCESEVSQVQILV